MNIVKKDSIMVMGYGWSGSYQAAERGEVQKVWARFLEDIRKISYSTDKPRVICPFHDRETEFTYYIGLEVGDTELSELPPEMTKIHIPAREYATFTHSGPVEKYLKPINRPTVNWRTREFNCFTTH